MPAPPQQPNLLPLPQRTPWLLPTAPSSGRRHIPPAKGLPPPSALRCAGLFLETVSRSLRPPFFRSEHWPPLAKPLSQHTCSRGPIKVARVSACPDEMASVNQIVPGFSLGGGWGAWLPLRKALQSTVEGARRLGELSGRLGVSPGPVENKWLAGLGLDIVGIDERIFRPVLRN